jgi:hypothetical protein
MKLKIGDKVKFLNDIGGGTILRIDGKIAYVRNEDGFEIPTTLTELVYSGESEANRSKGTSESTKSEPKISRELDVSKIEVDVKQDCNILLAVSPENPEKASISDLKLYLINDSSYLVFYTTFIDDSKGYQQLKSGSIEPNTKIVLKKFFQSSISQISKIRTQLLFTGSGSFEPKEPIDREINLAAYTFYKQSTYTSNEYFTHKALVINVNSVTEESYALDDKQINDLIPKKERKPIKVDYKSPKPQTEIVEIDLHIHEVTNNYEGLSNSEMVEIQMNTFRTELLNAINNAQVKKIVFIHGVGNGTLKRELRSELDRKYKKLQYQDASFKEYGFGATLVYLRY